MCVKQKQFWVEIDRIVQDISVFKLKFGASYIGYMPRSCNVVAHSLARSAVDYKASSCWEAPFPAWLTKLATVDCGVCSSS
ncbi:hypothetical protein JRO89_XS02G0196800 [Xanthoceras sorbifolium]|uniref:RNase H type-1 domain-containing protein n=1 Tax=Xanthoceras sorbifolium TaxID=99658 RepID=A0ABQ8IGK2_9ROSI|nr:hypothetical protein JRO89_XS02G0196800 [Xanthoceras sorbifolium]